jgi:anaerobic selenocysteine-containing dehydrogenase
MEIRRTACPLDCPDACSLEVGVEQGRVRRIGAGPRNPYTREFICGKVRSYADHVESPERILHPGIREGQKGEGRFRRVGWDEALDRIAQEMHRVTRESGGESILPVSYGGSNGLITQDTTDARLFRRLKASRLARTVCAAPTRVAADGLYGRMAGVALADYVHAGLIVVWGTNPGASGIHFVPVVREARRRGARLVVVDPRATGLAEEADLHLAPLPGTDLVLALAVIRSLFEEGGADTEFLERHATGAAELRRRAAGWSFEKASQVCGIGAGDLAAFARLYAETNPAVIRCGWGLERNRNGGSAVAAVLALPAVAGKFGVRGGGYTMSNSAVYGLEAEAAACEPEPATRILNMNRLGETLVSSPDPPIRLLFVYNCNPLVTLPEQEKVRRGLRRGDLFTVVFDQVLTDTAQYADVVLPATTFLEHRDLSKGYGALILQDVVPVIPAAGEARSNPEVFADLCRRTGLARPGEPSTAEEIRDAILRAHPDGARYRQGLEGAGFALPGCGDAPVQFRDVLPRTPDRKIHLVPESLDHEAPGGLYVYRPNPDAGRYPLTLISPATSRTISSSLGQLRESPARVDLHPADAAARGIRDGDRVRIHNDRGEVHCLARIDPAVREGVAVLPKGLWTRSTLNGSTSNALVPDTLADLGGGACFNDARVEVGALHL